MGWFDWLFKRKKNKQKQKENVNEKETNTYQFSEQAAEERRILNHQAYEDDTILNFEPSIGDEVNEEFKKYQDNLMQEKNNSSGETDLANIKVKSPIQSILDNARLKNDESIQQVLAESETQRKLKMIEDYQKGKIKEIDPNLYTDVNKSVNADNYHTRAANMLNGYQPMTIQEELEKRRKLSEQRSEVLKKLKENTLLQTYNYEKEERLKYRVDQLKNKK